MHGRSWAEWVTVGLVGFGLFMGTVTMAGYEWYY